MLKKLFFLFLMISYSTTQALAVSCETSCTFQESIAKAHKSTPTPGHECCHGSENKKEDKNKCIGDFSSACLHEVLTVDSIKFLETEISNKVIHFTELPVLAIINRVNIVYRYKPKVVDDQFLAYRSQLDLYILKEQFLN